MDITETGHIITAAIVLALLIALPNISTFSLSQAISFSIIVLGINIFTKKIVAKYYETDIEHKIWSFSRYWLHPRHKLEKPLPMGVIIPLFFSFITLGVFKCMTLLTYEAKARKERAAKRHGFYSFTQLTDWHNGLIGAAGISSLFILAIVAYLSGFESLAKIASYYAFFNMLPLSNLDGNQIFFGSRILYSIVSAITIIFTIIALAIH